MSHLVLASGGLDSTVLAAMAPEDALHVFVDYGQLHVAQERAASAAVAAHYRAARITVPVPILGALLPCALTGVGDLDDPPVVPNRNAILLSIAVGIAHARGLEEVWIGCNAEDHAEFPDCRPEFIAAADVLAHTFGVAVVAPLLAHTKPEIGDLAHELGVPVALTWSCYAGEAEPCGACGACQARGRALHVHHH